MFREENEPSFLKIRLLLKSKLEKNCIELRPTVIVTKKDFFNVVKFFPGQAYIFLQYYVLNNGTMLFKEVINQVFQRLHRIGIILLNTQSFTKKFKPPLFTEKDLDMKRLHG